MQRGRQTPVRLRRGALIAALALVGSTTAATTDGTEAGAHATCYSTASHTHAHYTHSDYWQHYSTTYTSSGKLVVFRNVTHDTYSSVNC